VSIVLNLASVALGLIGIAVAYYFYRRDRVKVAWGLATIPRPAKDGQEAETFVLVRNESRDYVDHILEPIHVETVREGVRILKGSVVNAQDKSARIEVSPDGSFAELSIAYIAPGEDLLFRIEHTGLHDTDLRLDAKIRGVSKLRRLPSVLVQHKVFDPYQLTGSRGRLVKTSSEQNLGKASETLIDPGSPMQSAPSLSDIGGQLLHNLSPDEVKALSGLRVLEVTIARLEDSGGPDSEAQVNAVRFALRRAQVFALGDPAGDTSMPGHGTESDLLHFTIDDDRGKEIVLLPLFSAPDLMVNALQRNTEWQTLSILQIDGDDIQKNADPDVYLVINPWTRLEFQLPPLGNPDQSMTGSSDQGLAPGQPESEGPGPLPPQPTQGA
jgi:hypothetical protein